MRSCGSHLSVILLCNYPSLSFSGSNLCNRQTNPNGDCSHFCFPAPDSRRVCGCPYGMKLLPNQQTCVDDPSNEPPTLQCGANSFSCGNGKCVPNSYRCDGVDDCHDNSDELKCGINSNAFFVFVNPVYYTGIVWPDRNSKKLFMPLASLKFN